MNYLENLGVEYVAASDRHLAVVEARSAYWEEHGLLGTRERAYLDLNMREARARSEMSDLLGALRRYVRENFGTELAWARRRESTAGPE
jgi:hypothetical protein